MAPRLLASKRPGFTLLELIVVILILAAVAAMVVPRLGWVESRAGNSAAANTIATLTSNLEVYKSSAGSYPLGFDSLIAGSALYNNLWAHDAYPQIGPKFYLEARSFATTPSGAQWSASFGHSFSPAAAGSSYYVYDHSNSASDPSSSANTVRNFATTGTFAFVKKTSGSEFTPPSSFAPGPSYYLGEFHRALGYPPTSTTGGDGTTTITHTVPTTVELIAFGIGPNAGSGGETMVSAPRHLEQEPEFYGRYIAIFAVYSNGKPAELKGIIDSQGGSVQGNISDYMKAAPEHD